MSQGREGANTGGGRCAGSSFLAWGARQRGGGRGEERGRNEGGGEELLPCKLPLHAPPTQSQPGRGPGGSAGLTAHDALKHLGRTVCQAGGDCTLGSGSPRVCAARGAQGRCSDSTPKGRKQGAARDGPGQAPPGVEGSMCPPCRERCLGCPGWTSVS